MKKRLLLLAAFAALVGSASAQGFGGGMMRMGQTSTMASLMLLNRADVQEEIKVTDDQKSKLDALRQGTRTRFQAAMSGMRGGDPSEMQTKMQSVIEDLAKDGLGILTDEQKKRLKELSVQSSGALVVLQPDVAKQLTITAAQKAKIDELQQQQGEANQGLFEQMQNGEIERDELQTRMQKNRDKMEEVVVKLLTDSQKVKLKELGGKPFEFKDPKPGTAGSFGRPGGG